MLLTERKDTLCGLGPCFTSRWLTKKFANISSFMCVYLLLTMISDAAFSYPHSINTTIEKRYKISSGVIGVITGFNDVVASLCAIFGTYYISKRHRPRWIGIGAVIVAIHCFVNFLPSYIWGPGEDVKNLTEEHFNSSNSDMQMSLKSNTLCRAGLNDSLLGAECSSDSQDSGDWLKPLHVFFLAQFINGLGSFVLFTLGSTYLDDNCDKATAPILIAITNVVRTAAPMLGGIITKFCLSTFVSLELTPTITPADPRWIGAWWMGWLILGISLLLVAVPISMFPETLPAMAGRRQRVLVERRGTAVASAERNLKDFWKTLKRLLSNKVALYSILSMVLYVSGIQVPASYMVKNYEAQYRIPAENAGFYYMISSSGPSMIGVIISGQAMSTFKPSARSVAIWGMIATSLSLVGSTAYPFLGCNATDLQMKRIDSQRGNPYLADCKCDFVKFSPVCFKANETSFVSACHAGCRDFVTEGEKIKEFTHCLSLETHPSADIELEHTVSPGMCRTECNDMWVLNLWLTAAIAFVTSSARTGQMLTILRCVDARDKEMVLSLVIAFIHILPMALAPFAFGKLIDGTCIMWEKTCSGLGNCWLHNTVDMRYFFYSLVIAFLMLQLIFDFGVFCKVGHVKIFDDEEEDDEEEDEDQNRNKKLGHASTEEVSADTRISRVEQNESHGNGFSHDELNQSCILCCLYRCPNSDDTLLKFIRNAGATCHFLRLVVLQTAMVATTMSYVYFVATLTTMERRFKIPSKTTGLMLSGNEISQILLSLVLTYFGGRGNRPRWIAAGVAISALSCFILALPHLVYGPGRSALALTKEFHGEVNNTYLQSSIIALTSPICGTAFSERQTQIEQSCTSEDENNSTDGNYSLVPILLVFLSQFVLGIGTTLYWALGQIYLDDNAGKAKTPLFLGLTLALRTLGPAFGFVIAFGCLNIYIDPFVTPTISMSDPRWLGAWWLGWIFLGVMMLVFAVLISLFPHELPPKASKKGIKLQAPLLAQREPEKPGLKEFPRALKRILSNKLLMTNIASSTFYILGASGYITYVTKYMEVQYNKTAANAGILAGTSGLLAMTLGFLVSGYVISKFQPRAKYVLGWNVVTGLTYILAEISFIFIGCPDVLVQGFNSFGEQYNLTSECNAACSCPDNLHFSPICINETTFFSACHAGCQNIFEGPEGTNRNVTFSQCSCAASTFLTQFTDSESFGDLLATEGTCIPECPNMFLWFLIGTYIMHMIGSSGKVGNILVNFR
ncbi:Hypothetical predicted protein [Cloeon dipterum]|uniref:Solute carrier organic anion transporter family member n=1 Tax=Cloeon dipterum TaxID=197152 RepID=A0A8S1E6T1_9INSE|nr:Hypothetical predicted protein [Cloeon dipterum]